MLSWLDTLGMLLVCLLFVSLYCLPRSTWSVDWICFWTGDSSNGAYEALAGKEGQSFGRIFLSKSMIIDHLGSTYIAAIKSCIRRVQQSWQAIFLPPCILEVSFLEPFMFFWKYPGRVGMYLTGLLAQIYSKLAKACLGAFFLALVFPIHMIWIIMIVPVLPVTETVNLTHVLEHELT